jgi:Family of unknown function (DUF6459)
MMLTEESAIRLMSPPELWAPADQTPAAGTAAADPGHGTRLPSEPEPTPALEQGPALPRQFAVLLTEVLAGMRPQSQVAPWLTVRGGIHLHRLTPLFASGHQPKVLRVLTMRPAPGVVEMTVIAIIGPRTRALAVRLEQGTRHGTGLERWLCTDIEAA